MLHSKRALEEESEHLSVKTIKLIHHSNSENQLLETHHGHTCFPTPSEDQKFKSHGSNDHGNMSTERPFTDKQGKMIKPDVVLQELHVMPHIWAEVGNIFLICDQDVYPLNRI